MTITPGGQKKKNKKIPICSRVRAQGFSKNRKWTGKEGRKANRRDFPLSELSCDMPEQMLTGGKKRDGGRGGAKFGESCFGGIKGLI